MAGSSFLIARAASIPFRMGILTSKTTTSGLSRRADFDLVYPDCRKAAVEVTMTIDEHLQRTWSKILDKRKGIIHANCCKRSWHITISSSRDTHIDRIRKQVDKCLSEIEQAGITEFRGATDSNEHVRRIYADLGVVYGSVLPEWVDPPRVLIGLPGPLVKLTASAAVDAAESKATKPDNIKKLGASVCGERHLAVYAPPHSLASFGLWMHKPPQKRANLPPEITHLWIFGEDLARFQTTSGWSAT